MVTYTIFLAAVLTATPPQEADSTQIHEAARDAQEDFERFRETRIPAELQTRRGRCDEPIGRLCLSYPGEQTPIEPPSRSIVEERDRLLGQLREAGEALPGDGWIAGQRVRYLLETDDLLGAREVVENCRAVGWWCAALRGLVLHSDGRWVEAGESFLETLGSVPEEEMEKWEGEEWMVERAARDFLGEGGPAERERRRALLWRLADPLFLVPGNDRWTEHMARLTLARTLEDAWNPFGLPWGEDLEEIALRYGWALGWERGRGLPPLGGRQIQENRMVARLDPDRRRFVPTGEALEAFPNTELGELDVGTARDEFTGYTPPYARTVENLSGQTGRFLRDDELLVVHAFGVVPPPVDSAVSPVRPPDDLRTGLFLLPVMGPVIEDGPVPLRDGSTLGDVWTATVPRGDHILSLEAWSRFDRRAWRTRRGLVDLPRTEGRLAASDPVLLDPDAGPLPETLEEALPQVTPTVEREGGTLIRIGWEVYGIPEGAVARVSLGLEPAERSFLRRLGEFFRVLEPPAPVTIRWDDAEVERPGTVFRAIDLQLPILDEGAWDLFLEITIADEEPAVARRRFLVREPS